MIAGNNAISRNALLSASAAYAEDGTEPRKGDKLTVGHVVIVAYPQAHLLLTVIEPGSIRRVEVWISPVGVIATAHQEHDDEPAAVIALPPQDAYEVVVGSASLNTHAVFDREAPTQSLTLASLVRRVVESDVHNVRACVFDWEAGGRSSRWLVLDEDRTRLGSLATAQDLEVEIELQALSPMALATAQAAAVTAGITP